MYIRFIWIKNQGSIDELKIEPRFNEDGTPKPILIVGENGSGKTTLLSSIVDSFYAMAGKCFDNIYKIDNTGNKKIYKIGGDINLKIGEDFEFTEIKYDEDIGYVEYYKEEKSNKSTKFEKEFFKVEITENPTFIRDIALIQNEIITLIDDINNKSTENKLLLGKIKNELKNKIHFYLPAYRYEEPFWKVKEYHNYKVEDKEDFSYDEYNKEIEIFSSFKKNKKFVSNLLLDYYITSIENKNIDKIKIFINLINSIIQKIKQNEDLSIKISDRYYDNKLIIINTKNNNRISFLSQLSLGEMNLFNMFINILRHADNKNLKSEKDIEGIVVIDEIEAHLHTKFQTKILPDLISLFPKIQFIITTHSPMFILGMKEKFGEDGFDIFEMPNGKKITTEEFREFKEAYETLKNTQEFEKDLEKKIKNLHKPLVFTEGATDIEYIKTALEIFDKKELLDKFEFIGASGEPNLTHLLNSPDFIDIKMLLIFDCDVSKEKKSKGNKMAYKISKIKNNPIEKGIENLFPQDLIEKLYKKFTKKYITKNTKDDELVKYKIIDKEEDNKSHKKTIQEEICKNYATEENFANFKKIVEKIEEFLNKDNTNAN